MSGDAPCLRWEGSSSDFRRPAPAVRQEAYRAFEPLLGGSMDEGG